MMENGVMVLTPQQVMDKMKAGAVLVDVREVGEFAAGHVPGAVNVPLGEVSAEKLRAIAGEKPLIVMCLAGMRSAKACVQVQGVAAGMLNGGLKAWVAAGLPVEEGVMKAGWWARLPLERKTQMVIGVLVVVFSVLALVVSPWWALGSLVVGVGLFQAGVTGWCCMALLLARLGR